MWLTATVRGNDLNSRSPGNNTLSLGLLVLLFRVQCLIGSVTVAVGEYRKVNSGYHYLLTVLYLGPVFPWSRILDTEIQSIMIK